MEISVEDLYTRIPAFNCLPGCSACCGPIAMTGKEWAKFPKKRYAKSLADTCPYSKKGRCEFYECRPLICRIFGATVDLACPHGCRPDRYLTKRESREIMTAYMQLLAVEGEQSTLRE